MKLTIETHIRNKKRGWKTIFKIQFDRFQLEIVHNQKNNNTLAFKIWIDMGNYKIRARRGPNFRISHINPNFKR